MFTCSLEFSFRPELNYACSWRWRWWLFSFTVRSHWWNIFSGLTTTCANSKVIKKYTHNKQVQNYKWRKKLLLKISRNVIFTTIIITTQSALALPCGHNWWLASTNRFVAWLLQLGSCVALARSKCFKCTLEDDYSNNNHFGIWAQTLNLASLYISMG